jgi:hypothetical protein
MTVHRVSSLAWERGTRLAFHLGSLATRRLHIGRPDVGEVTYRQLDGDTQQVPPADQSFWAATAVGTGPQTLTWEQERGEWAMVIRNADATPGSGGRRLGGGPESPSTWCSASMKPGDGRSSPTNGPTWARRHPRTGSFFKDPATGQTAR